MVGCGCHCMGCGGTDLRSCSVGVAEPDGYCETHHTCNSCNAHFDHLDGRRFDSCERCGFGAAG